MRRDRHCRGAVPGPGPCAVDRVIGHWVIGHWVIGHWVIGHWAVGHWAVGIDPAAGELAQGRSQRPAITLDDKVVESEQTLFDVFVDSGSIPGGNQFEDFVDTRYNDAIADANASTN